MSSPAAAAAASDDAREAPCRDHSKEATAVAVRAESPSGEQLPMDEGAVSVGVGGGSSAREVGGTATGTAPLTQPPK